MSFLLLLAFLVLPQEKSEGGPPQKAEPAPLTEGELILQKVKRALTANVALRFTVNTENRAFQVLKPDGGQIRMQVTLATIDLQPGNRMKIDGRFPIRDLKWPDVPDHWDADWMVLESDGASMSVTPYGKPVWAKGTTSKTLNRDLLRDFLYLGVRFSIVEQLKALTPLAAAATGADAELMRDSAVSLLGREKLDNDVEALKLELKPRKSTGPATPATTLWIDPRTYLPVRRETRTEGTGWWKVDLEKYTDFGNHPFN